MQFPLLLLLLAKNCGKPFTAIIHIPHCTAQMMDSERAGVLLATIYIYLRLMHSTLYSTLFRCHVVFNICIITGVRYIIHVCHKHMHTLVRAAILRLRCLHACIFLLKSAYLC